MCVYVCQHAGGASTAAVFDEGQEPRGAGPSVLYKVQAPQDRHRQDQVPLSELLALPAEDWKYLGICTFGFLNIRGSLIYAGRHPPLRTGGFRENAVSVFENKDLVAVSMQLIDILCRLTQSHNTCVTFGDPVWAKGRCRISPPRFLAECCKRQLNQGSFVFLYFRLFFTFSDLY